MKNWKSIQISSFTYESSMKYVAFWWLEFTSCACINLFHSDWSLPVTSVTNKINAKSHLLRFHELVCSTVLSTYKLYSTRCKIYNLCWWDIDSKSNRSIIQWRQSGACAEDEQKNEIKHKKHKLGMRSPKCTEFRISGKVEAKISVKFA